MIKKMNENEKILNKIKENKKEKKEQTKKVQKMMQMHGANL